MEDQVSEPPTRPHPSTSKTTHEAGRVGGRVLCSRKRETKRRRLTSWEENQLDSSHWCKIVAEEHFLYSPNADLTNQNHQTGPLIGPLLVASHLLVDQEIRISGFGALARRSLPIFATQPETPPQTSYSKARDGRRRRRRRKGSGADSRKSRRLEVMILKD